MADARADDDPTGDALSKECEALQSSANLAWDNASMVLRGVLAEGGSVSIADAERALQQYRAARTLQLAAEQALIDHATKRIGP
jgi:hypothetical protein